MAFPRIPSTPERVIPACPVSCCRSGDRDGEKPACQGLSRPADTHGGSRDAPCSPRSLGP
jgi:hypothetical protein